MPSLGPLAWNVIVTLAEPTFRIARRLLARWGELRRTEYFNVAVMAVADPAAFLREFSAALADIPAFSMRCPMFWRSSICSSSRTRQSLRPRRARLLSTCRKLAGKSFHVRLHRRGLKGTISTPTEERFLDDVLLQALAAAGHPGRIVSTIRTACCCSRPWVKRGLALWMREDLKRYPFLGAV